MKADEEDRLGLDVSRRDIKATCLEVRLRLPWRSE